MFHELAPVGRPLIYTDSKKGIHSQWTFLNGDRVITVCEIVPIEDIKFKEIKQKLVKNAIALSSSVKS